MFVLTAAGCHITTAGIHIASARIYHITAAEVKILAFLDLEQLQSSFNRYTGVFLWEFGNAL